MTTALAVIQKMNETFRTLQGLNAVLDYEPTTIEPPMLYTIVSDIQPTRQGSLDVPRYYFLHRVCLAWLDNRTAEHQLLYYADAIYQAVKDDPYLGGLLTDKLGMMKVESQTPAFLLVGTTRYRILDTLTSTLAKRPT